MDDKRLMLEVKRGDRRAFDTLYHRYARRLQGFFFRQLGGDEERAADAMQDTLLRVFEHRERYVEGSDVGTWVFSIAYNLCKNIYRNNAYEAQYLQTLDAQPAEESAVEIQMDHERLMEALQQVLDALPPPLRLLFSLRHEEELTVPQIAAILQIPEGTVKSRLHKTMNLIRQQLKHYEHI
jgi:RNA polymerase sigma-70 factor (ECF subfamily)